MAQTQDSSATAATILIAHGSRNPAAQEAHVALVEAVTEAAPGNPDLLYPAYLEMAAPDIPTAVDSAVAAGATTVRLLPCFLHPGNHVEVDIPAIAAEARRRHPDASVEVMSHLGSHGGLVDLLAAMVTEREARAELPGG